MGERNSTKMALKILNEKDLLELESAINSQINYLNKNNYPDLVKSLNSAFTKFRLYLNFFLQMEILGEFSEKDMAIVEKNFESQCRTIAGKYKNPKEADRKREIFKRCKYYLQNKIKNLQSFLDF